MRRFSSGARSPYAAGHGTPVPVWTPAPPTQIRISAPRAAPGSRAAADHSDGYRLMLMVVPGTPLHRLCRSASGHGRRGSIGNACRCLARLGGGGGHAPGRRNLCLSGGPLAIMIAALIGPGVTTAVTPSASSIYRSSHASRARCPAGMEKRLYPGGALSRQGRLLSPCIMSCRTSLDCWWCRRPYSLPLRS